MKHASDAKVVRYAAGELDTAERAALEVHFDECAECAARRDAYHDVAGRLAPDRDEFDDPQLADDVMTLIRLGRADADRAPALQRPIRWWPRLLVPAAAAALATVAVVALWPGLQGADDHGFVARGGSLERADRWVSLTPFRATDAGYERVTDRIAADDALAFSYQDRSPAPFGYLMVLAVDGRGQVFWYYPAWLRPDEHPTSVATSVRPGPIELPEQTRHALAPGPLRVFALFSRRPLDVRTVEAEVARQVAAAGGVRSLERLDFNDTGQQSCLLMVEAAAGRR